MEEFKKALMAAAEASVVKHQNAANHALRQAFFDGVRFHAEFMQKSLPKPNVEAPPA
jgi:hypothetical protein